MISISFASRKPIYEQIYDDIIKQATFGVLLPNDKLPPVRTLATQLGVNPNTVSKAYSNLERDGYIHSVVGRGSFISENLNSIELQKQCAEEKFIDAAKNAKNAGVKIDRLQSKLYEVYQKEANV